MHLSKTDILERAVDYYAKRQIRSHSDLMKFAGGTKAVLVTNNTRHFDRVKGLRIENWLRE
ncbi:virulence factor [Coxiella burnetii]|uniref:Virulence-associated protein C n=2 Tax=Coxiella burnetii TaxID=777 RepID=B5QSE6_COXBU|nr:virulence factor [Coxiella burnetii]YP_002333019.1 virulence-associated protein C [Coxiella burnetii RSA 493]ACI15310.1 virulence-associated protein C [Coxiella burnetii RSA 493]ACI23089.1 virulence-associated protein C [Coxiella burnetii Dugway 5J108-111]ACJ17797.1 virulence-associated protein C [Coxiella burnetii CbuG_Q212]ACJ19655.1 virulence-associated protein C [Coxiella burnetii CbuK_Q154]AML48460.1 virulence factor [Coxiella burnetii]